MAKSRSNDPDVRPSVRQPASQSAKEFLEPADSFDLGDDVSSAEAAAGEWLGRKAAAKSRKKKIAERKNRPWLGRGCDDEGIGACAESSCRTRCGVSVERGRVRAVPTRRLRLAQMPSRILHRMRHASPMRARRRAIVLRARGRWQSPTLRSIAIAFLRLSPYALRQCLSHVLPWPHSGHGIRGFALTIRPIFRANGLPPTAPHLWLSMPKKSICPIRSISNTPWIRTTKRFLTRSSILRAAAHTSFREIARRSLSRSPTGLKRCSRNTPTRPMGSLACFRPMKRRLL